MASMVPEKITINDAVTTLMYASAVNVIMANSLNLDELGMLGSIGAMLFIFIDWLSRIWIPMSFQEDDQTKRRRLVVQLMKGLIEIVGIYLFVVAAFSILSPVPYRNVQNVFAYFLLLCFGWNALMLRVMVDLGWKRLTWAALVGSVFDLKGTTTYVGRYKRRVLLEEQKIKDNDTTQEWVKHWQGYLCRLIVESFGRTVGQLLANHITWVSFVVAVVLLIGAKLSYEVPLPQEIVFLVLLRLGLLFSIVAIPTALFFCYYLVSKRTEEKNLFVGALRLAAGLAAIVLQCLFYLTWTRDSIVYVMVIEQSICGLFLQYATSKISTPAEPVRIL